MLIKNANRHEARAKLDKCVSSVNLYSLSRNGEILSLLQQTSSQWFNDRFFALIFEPPHILHLGF